MADVGTAKPPSLSEQYLLKGKEETSEVITKPVEEAEVKTSENITVAEEVVEKAEDTPVVENSEVPPTGADGSSEASDTAAGESTEATPAAEAGSGDDTPASESAESEVAGDQESIEDAPHFTLETAPADFRFPTTNQTRHCFTRYIEYHRCIAAKGEGASECQKFAKYYRSLCPGEWIDRWNEQRENGTFPGPL
ncbi:uncharacterized protein [Coffea arabica]|uniref:Uncharacterized protein n=1 Tax=Coffea arabica TaxID=13443 RepID=A0A6P6UWH3_COFAR|nr:cytochrome c oxidase subunit 6b-1-like [Coffea arabica]